MKKIALLLAIVCVGQLYGMEPLYPGLCDLPQELHSEIVKKAVESSDTLEKMVKAINVASALQGVRYDNLQNFIRLVNVLANKFNMFVSAVAQQFDTPIAKKYDELGKKLGDAFGVLNDEQAVSAIKEGADVNYISNPNGSPILFAAIRADGTEATLELLQLLLAHGEDIHFIHPDCGNILDHVAKSISIMSAYGGRGKTKIMQDKIMKFLLNSFCASLDQEECEKIRAKYQKHLLTEKQVIELNERIAAKRIRQGK